MKWGIYDPIDKSWIGDDNGPRLFDEEILARLGAEIIDVMCGWPRRRCLEKRFPDMPVRFKGTVDGKMTALEALKGMENGRYL